MADSDLASSTRPGAVGDGSGCFQLFLGYGCDCLQDEDQKRITQLGTTTLPREQAEAEEWR